MSEVRLAFLPYCIRRVKHGWYVILNRDYKPLGAPSGYKADYEQFMIKIPYLTEAKARKMSFNNSSDRTNIMLYNDSCIPTTSDEHAEAYSKRLIILSKLKIANPEVWPKTECTHKFPDFE